MGALVMMAAGCTGAKASTPPESAVAEAEAPLAVTEPVADSTTVAETTTTVAKSVLGRMLETGLAPAEDVRVVQERLNALHFDVGRADGIYGSNTEMAVWAYQADILGLRGAEVTGKVTPELWQRIQEPLGLSPLRPDASPTHVEINLPAQVLTVYVNKEVRLITHMSSGDGKDWCAVVKSIPLPGATTTTLAPGLKGSVCGKSTTPGGTYKIFYKKLGWSEIPLGRVYNMMKFNGGIAIHGYEQVPKNPASHGCVRVPMHIAEYLPDVLHNGDEVFVFDGAKEPEFYGAQRPPIDVPDPTDTTVATIPTTTTTTIKPTTTVAGATTTTAKPTTPPVTTAPPTTTAKPAPPATPAPTTPAATTVPPTAPPATSPATTTAPVVAS